MSRSTPSSPNPGGAKSASFQQRPNYNLLKPPHRKLRHLRNFHLYNLSLSLAFPSESKHHHNNGTIAKAKSFTDLNSNFQRSELSADDGNITDNIKEPALGSIISKDPFERQIRLQMVNSQRIVDTFISVHNMVTDQVVYITEIKYRDMNPYFAEFDLGNSNCSKLDSVRIKIWCCSKSEWNLLIKLDLLFSMLIFIGESLNELQYKDDNMVILELVDGFYLVPNPSYHRFKTPIVPNGVVESHSGIKRSSSSFDQLMKLNNLQYCIKDSEKNKSILSSKIAAVLVKTKQQNELLNSIQLLKISIGQIRHRNEETKGKLSYLQMKLQDQRNLLLKLSTRNSRFEKEQGETRDSYGATLNNLRTVKQNLQLEKYKIVHSIRYIFPISQVNNHSNQYQILQHQLPSSFKKLQLTKSISSEIAFVLNLVSQLVMLLSYYLAIPLRYPMKPFGSNSYINDPISQLNVSVFPLWINNLHSIEKFEYGLLLLNKNIEQLLESIGMRAIDHRNILGNLNILLVCLSDDNSNETQDNSLVKKRIEFIKSKKSQILQHRSHHQQVV